MVCGDLDLGFIFEMARLFGFFAAFGFRSLVRFVTSEWDKYVTINTRFLVRMEGKSVYGRRGQASNGWMFGGPGELGRRSRIPRAWLEHAFSIGG